MNTSALRPFAQHARNLLREGVERRINYWGFDKNGKNKEALEAVTGGYTFRGKVYDDASASPKWNKLKAAINSSSYDEVVEKAAYTWFNRLMAMKILSKNGYETTQLDYLLETHTPAILERARRGQYSFLNAKEKLRLQNILNDYEKDQESFAILLIGYCHQHPLLQGIFGSIDDYTELLLPDDILTENGFLYFLNAADAISDEDYKQVELIGWLYQFYISEKKDEVFAAFKQNKKAEAKDIPAATQIFTPNWIVKYMVQNTLGHTWLDAHPNSELKKDWKYLVEPSKEIYAEKDTDQSLAIDQLTFLDPAVGSGHILVEAFDVLYPMYMAEYYRPDEAVQSILDKNIFGLDLDLRAVQLAQFALILKAAKYSRIVLQGKTLPRIYAMPQHRIFSREEVALFLGNENANYVDQVYKTLQTMEQAQNLGSIMVLELNNEAKKTVEERQRYWRRGTALNLEEEIIREIFPAYISILLILTSKFTCVATNPPYMGHRNMNSLLRAYVKENYTLSNADLFTVFMDVCETLLLKNGIYSMINQHSWMFYSSYEQFRMHLLDNLTINSLLHLGPRVFEEISGEVVQSVAFTISINNNSTGKTGSYFKLSKFESSEKKKDAFLKKSKKEYFTKIYQEKFSKIPWNAMGFWIKDELISLFENSSLTKYGKARQGIKTGDNEYFIKYWHEIDFSKKSKKWFPVNKGGEKRKWFGNNTFFLNWENNGEEIKNFKDPKGKLRSRPQNVEFFFREGLTWTGVSSGGFSCRFSSDEFCFESSGSMFHFVDKKYMTYILSFLNSKVADYFFEVFAPGLTYTEGAINSLPIIFEENRSAIDKTVNLSLTISKKDWDSRETSWSFQANPLLAIQQGKLADSYQNWLYQASNDFFRLHVNEEELNSEFIKVYGLQNELTPELALRDITILQEELDYDILEQMRKPYDGQLVPVHADVVMEQLISYIIGCFMGRYRLDKPSLHIAHSNPSEEELAPYFVKTGEERHFQFQIDDDAIIPLMGGNGNFTDDTLQKVNEFLTIIWGDDTLTENINFLQQQLDRNIEDYLAKDFWKYHVKTYSKRPIYWLFASKKGAFQVLVYMHRMNAFTLAKIRSKYLIPHISWLQNCVINMEKNAAILNRNELKKVDGLRKQLAECEEYDLLLKDMADKQISFDLDEGVTKNYALFKGVVAEIK